MKFNDFVFYGLMAVIAFFVGSAFFGAAKESKQRQLLANELQTKAVELGYAEWRVTNNTTGQTGFFWITNQFEILPK